MIGTELRSCLLQPVPDATESVVLTLERQYFLDDFDSLPKEAQSEVIDLVKRQAHETAKRN